jgi:hypothetical protein
LEIGIHLIIVGDEVIYIVEIVERVTILVTIRIEKNVFIMFIIKVLGESVRSASLNGFLELFVSEGVVNHGWLVSEVRE